MRRPIAAVAAVLLSLQPVAFAAEGPTTIRVALTDMSSAAGGWRGAGPGPGQGPGAGSGWGMMGPGMMGWGGQGGGRGMGPGMMGPGMMAIRIDRDTVPAGEIRFDVTNWSRGLVHEMLVVPVADVEAPLPYDATEGRVAESQVKVIADTEDMRPNASRTVDVTLTPGAYLLICNVPGHYAAGMVTALTVTP